MVCRLGEKYLIFKQENIFAFFIFNHKIQCFTIYLWPSRGGVSILETVKMKICYGFIVSDSEQCQADEIEKGRAWF